MRAFFERDVGGLSQPLVGLEVRRMWYLSMNRGTESKSQGENGEPGKKALFHDLQHWNPQLSNPEMRVSNSDAGCLECSAETGGLALTEKLQVGGIARL